MLILAERVEALQKEAAALKEFNVGALVIKAKDQIIA
jgi:cytidine deaminase